MRALVTGATGFIGGALAAYLIEHGWEVRLLLRNPQKALPDCLQGCQKFTHDFDQDDFSVLNPAVKNCDVVFHASAIRNRWGTLPKDFYKINVTGTLQLLLASLGKASRFVFISSVGVFGYPGVLGIDESFPVLPISSAYDYHTSKVCAEQIVMEHSQEIETTIIRPTITYGPGDETGMVTRLLELISKRRFIRIGNGRNSIHLTFVSDLIRGLTQAAQHPSAVGQTLILSGPHPVRIDHLLYLIEKKLSIQVPGVYIPEKVAVLLGACIEKLYGFAARPGSNQPLLVPPITRQMVHTFCANRSFSSQKATRLINYQPEIELEEGLNGTIEWMKANNRFNL